MKLESPKVTVRKSQEDFFNFLTDLNNFKDLMPPNTDKFEVDGASFIFSLKGMPEIRLAIKEKTPHATIVLGAASGKLDFTLTCKIDEASDESCDAQLFFEGDFNPMMAMMVKKPLQSFINTLTEKATNL